MFFWTLPAWLLTPFSPLFTYCRTIWEEKPVLNIHADTEYGTRSREMKRNLREKEEQFLVELINGKHALDRMA